MTTEHILYFEHVTERRGPTVLASTITPATESQIKEAAALHAAGKCPHNIVYDEFGFLYDIRVCGTCGAGLGAV